MTTAEAILTLARLALAAHPANPQVLDTISAACAETSPSVSHAASANASLLRETDRQQMQFTDLLTNTTRSDS